MLFRCLWYYAVLSDLSEYLKVRHNAHVYILLHMYCLSKCHISLFRTTFGESEVRNRVCFVILSCGCAQHYTHLCQAASSKILLVTSTTCTWPAVQILSGTRILRTAVIYSQFSWLLTHGTLITLKQVIEMHTTDKN